ncbi:MAG TPA: hypothetical protein VF043_23565 [Ktedonobacteraceae bacterium]
MNCPRCSTELPDSAQSCSRCGFQVRPSSFSYLPAGSPPWPTTAAQGFSSMASSSATAQTALPMQESAGVPAARNVSTSRKSTLSIPLIIGLFLISILVGGGATLGILYSSGRFPSDSNGQTSRPVILPSPGSAGATPTPQGTQLPNPGPAQTLKLADLGVSVKFPSDWQKVGPSPTPTNDLEVALRPQQQLGIDLHIRRDSATTSAGFRSVTQANQANLTAFSQFQGVNNLQATSTGQRSVGGAQWGEQDATFTDSNNLPYKFVSISAKHNNVYYTIYFYMPNQYFTEGMQKYIQPILDSFKFLS